MQPAQHLPIASLLPASLLMPKSLTPAVMAQTLRRAGGDAALCFARAMHADAAWANEAWGEYWADVIREV